MKKIFAILMATIMSISLVACGEIGGGQTDVNPKPTTTPEIKIQDISTEKGLLKAISGSPDANAKDGWWEYLLGRDNNAHAIGFPTNDETYKPFYIPEDKAFSTVKTSYGRFWRNGADCFYVGEHRRDPDTDEWLVDYSNAPNAKEFYERLDIDVSEFYIPEGSVKETYKIEGEFDGYGEEHLMKNILRWQFYLSKEAGISSIEVASQLWGDTLNINHYNDWCLANNLIYREGEDGFYLNEYLHLPLDEEGVRSYIDIADILCTYTLNYFNAKWNGEELTCPVSDSFSKAAPMDAVHSYLEAQKLLGDNITAEVDMMETSLTYAYPVVFIQYTITNNDTGDSITEYCYFYYDIIKENDEYRYALDYILDTSDEDIDWGRFKHSFEENFSLSDCNFKDIELSLKY